MAQIAIVGCGYTGERIAQLHLARGDQVAGSTRDAGRALRLQAAGVAVLQREVSSWPVADRIYYTVPPPASGDADTRIRDVLATLPAPASFVYFSTTGVYGDHGGKRVTEQTPVRPVTDRARRRVDAEAQVQAWCKANGCRAVILRIPGIYGPGRLPLEKLRRGEPFADATGPGNRIHVDDLARAALAAADSGVAGIWNVSDGNHLPTAAFADRVADLAGLPRPRRVPLESAEIPETLRSFLLDDRRVDNGKLLRLPGFRLLYSEPEAGIRASLNK